MCDTKEHPGLGWKSWIDVPQPVAENAGTEWIDLSHVLNEQLPKVPFFPAPRFGRIMSQPKHPLNVTEIQMVVHLGTHVDAPRHFFSDGPAFHEIPLERLHGRGVVWRIEKDDYGVIGVEDLERARPKLEPGDILALNTGWASHFGTSRYESHPCLSVAAAEWLVSQRIKLLACDTVTPDLAVSRREKGFDWPVHHVLLGQGVLVSEHLRNLEPLAGGRAEFMFLALNVQDADGSPARVLARKLD